METNFDDELISKRCNGLKFYALFKTLGIDGM